MKQIKKMLSISFLIIMILVTLINVSISEMISLPDEFYVDYQEIEQANREHKFGKFVNLELKTTEIDTSDSSKGNQEIVFKLFGFIPIKKVEAKVLPEEDVFVGGNTIGIDVSTDGVVVVSDTIVNMGSGEIEKNRYLKNGDVIQSFNGKKIKTLADLQEALANNTSENPSISILRSGEVLNSTISILKNKENEYKLGIWGRDSFSGVGTLTFALANNGQFGALGHAISSGNDNSILPITNGEIYECNLVNIEKGQKDIPGQLQCVFVGRDKRGTVEQNTNVGIFGNITDTNGIIDINKRCKLGGRLSVQAGKASLISSVSGIQEEYEIEIIKINKQKQSGDKSFVFRVKDERLLKLTGGIVQGMSGSPIIQNGKIVGAVTHVFVSDSTKGYGVYTDWMLEKLQ
ncbi:MAG: SpoIVB peptidase [Clostridiales bacterium]|nr:SpoIVB peptidase [Clostridiales bacterium]